MTNVKSLLALYLKMGGSLTDTYSDIAGGIPVGQYSLISDAVLACSKKYSSGGGLPADFPAEGAANKNKFLGFDNSGDYAALDAPSGAEKFVVTLTEDDSGAETVWTADKTIAEIVEAVEGGADVVATGAIEVGEGMSVNFEFPLAQYMSVGGAVASVFGGIVKIDGAELAVFSGFNAGSGDVWEYDRHSIGPELPSYSASNNGQVLGVSYGNPAWVDGNAPLIVTLTADSGNPDLYIGDHSFGEAFTAFNSGKNVVVKLSAGGASTSALVYNASSEDQTSYIEITLDAGEGLSMTGVSEEQIKIELN